MTLEWIERILRWAAGIAGIASLGLILVGLALGLRRPAGKASGRTEFMRSPFYLIVTLLYLGICILIWQPFNLPLDLTGRILFLSAGALIFVAGLVLVNWGRITLGKQYAGSTTFGAQLFVDHRLVTNGPFAILRHPMYLGYLFVGIGGVLLFQTWTMVFFALHLPVLFLRARREEQVLATQFGDEWLAYKQKVPAWLPRLTKKPLHPGAATLLEAGLLFLPAIPAYLWFWPSASGRTTEIAQIFVYVYFAIGTLWIGRRWTFERLGINRHGIWLGLACGAALIAARTLILIGVGLVGSSQQLSLGVLIGQAAFYIGLVGLVEELLFRGLIYRSLQDWLGTRWAIWGSSVAFGLWHIFGQGPLVGAATFFYGLIFVLVRLRAGGIIGLIFAHGLMDLFTVLMAPLIDVQSLAFEQPEFSQPVLVLIGVLGLLALPVYLWKIHPLWSRPSTRAAPLD